VERLLPQVRLEITIDSVKMRFTAADCPNGQATTIPTCWDMYLTVDNDGEVSQVVQNAFTATWGAFGGANTREYTLAEARVEADPASSAQFGIPEGFAGFNAAAIARFPEAIGLSGHVGQAYSRAGNTSSNSLVSPIPSGSALAPGGSRWFTGANETVPDPARLVRVGHIPGIDTIFSPAMAPGLAADRTTLFGGLPFNNACFAYGLGPVMRAADVEFRWSGTGAEVWDVTHNVPVPFMTSSNANYGFLVTDANGNGVIDYDDFIYIEGVHECLVTCTPASGRTPVQLAQAPALVPVSTQTATTQAGVAALAADGHGLRHLPERRTLHRADVGAADEWHVDAPQLRRLRDRVGGSALAGPERLRVPRAAAAADDPEPDGRLRGRAGDIVRERDRPHAGCTRCRIRTTRRARSTWVRRRRSCSS
jgi:hypothetical protein